MSWGRRHPGFLAAAAALVVVGLAFGVFYLFEENAFLRAEQADPALTRTPGYHKEALEIWYTGNILVMCAGFWSILAVMRRARGCTWKDMFVDTTWAYRPSEPIGERMRTFSACAGLVCLGSGILLLIKLIQTQVWEGDAPSSYYLQVYATAWCGLMLLIIAARDYRLAHFGTPSRQLTPDQLEGIRGAMEEFDLRRAIRLYRQAVPDASLAEAHQYALRLADTLRAQNPGKFSPRPLSLATLNWPALIICAFIEVILAGIAWFAFPPAAARGLSMQLCNRPGVRVGKCRRAAFERGLETLAADSGSHDGNDDLERRDRIRNLCRKKGASWTAWPFFFAVLFAFFLVLSALTRRRNFQK